MKPVIFEIRQEIRTIFQTLGQGFDSSHPARFCFGFSSDQASGPGLAIHPRLGCWVFLAKHGVYRHDTVISLSAPLSAT